MNNFETKKKYTSEEIVVRNVVLDFLLREYKYQLERRAINLKGGVIFITAQPIIKKKIIRDEARLRAELLKKDIVVVAFR